MCSNVSVPLRRSASAVLFAAVACLLAVDSAHALSQGANDPAVVVDEACVVGAGWFPAANAKASDDVYAQVSPAGAATHCLKATDYGFSIPLPAQITGIEVRIERHSSGGNIKDSSVKIVKGGAITGTDHADTINSWPLVDTVAIYGGSSDLWGTTWTPTDINAADFGVSLSAIDNVNTASVDVMRITVFYDLCADTPAGGCRTAKKGVFIVKDKGPNSAKDKMIWKWIKGQSTFQTEFGNPTLANGASNALCVYSNGALNAEAVVQPSTTKWKAISTKGWKYLDKPGTSDGITKIIQKGSTNDRSKILVKGKGAALPDIVPALTTPVEVQLVNSQSGICFTTTFNSAVKNVSGLFKAKFKTP
jgi:hypothetical protein